MARFEKKEVEENTFKIRDNERERWVGDGNGRQINLNDEERADNIADIMNKRVEGEWHE
jgi:hypothetical protein